MTSVPRMTSHGLGDLPGKAGAPAEGSRKIEKGVAGFSCPGKNGAFSSFACSWREICRASARQCWARPEAKKLPCSVHCLCLPAYSVSIDVFLQLLQMGARALIQCLPRAVSP